MVDQLGTVVNRANFNALRQPRIQGGDAGLDVGNDLGRVAALAHLNDAFDDAVVAVKSDDAGARTEPDGDGGHIRHQHRPAVFCHHDDATDVVQAIENADPAHQQRFVAAGDQAAADVGAVVAQRQAQLVDGDRVAFQGCRIDLHLVFLDGATKTDDIGHAADDAQVRANHPVLQCAHRVGVHRLGRFDDVAENFANRGRQRRQARLYAVRQDDVLQLFQHLLAGKIIVGAIGKRQRDNG